MRKVKFGAQLDTVVSQVVSQPIVVSQVVSPTTKEAKWRAAHIEQRRAIHRDGQRRRRTAG